VPTPRVSVLCLIATTLCLGTAPLKAQHCHTPGASPRLAIRAAGGVERGGKGHAAGGSLTLHARRWFVAGEFADRGWGLGRRTFRGLRLPGFMERQHQVLGLRAGGSLTLGTRSALCASLGYAIGTGLRVAYSGDPLQGGAGFESHHRVRADMEVARAITIGDVRLLPALSVGLLFVREEEIQDDIVLIGTTGYVPITMTVGVPIGRYITLRPRLNVPRGNDRGTSFGIDASVQLSRIR
jgi:hypothetical protein